MKRKNNVKNKIKTGFASFLTNDIFIRESIFHNQNPKAFKKKTKATTLEQKKNLAIRSLLAFLTLIGKRNCFL